MRVPLIAISITLLTAAAPAQPQGRWLLHPWREANGAATAMVPDGWTATGGVTYSNLGAQALLPKFNLVIGSPDGLCGVQWFEEDNFWSWGPAGDPGAQFGMPLQNYNGYYIMPAVDAAQFITTCLIPNQRAGMGMQVVEARPVPELAQRAQESQQANITAMASMGITGYADAAIVTAQGPQIDERYLACLKGTVQPMDGGTMAGSRMWSNTITIAWRAPRGQMAQWEPLLQIVRESLAIDPQWLAQEHQRQGRVAGQMRDLQSYQQQVLGEILDSRRATTAAIAHSGYLLITGQHERTNPVTGQTMLVPDGAANVWVDGQGNAVYSEDAGYNPANDQTLSGDWNAVNR